MIENQDFTLYFNLFFFGVIILGMGIGFLRGFRKTTYSFVTKFIFYVIFFVTLNIMVNVIWTLPMPFLAAGLMGIDSSFGGITTLSEALPIFTEMALGDTLGTTLQNENFLEFATSLSLFVVKIVYTIFYFTILNFIYRLITFIIRMIFFRTKKENKHKSKKRLPAMVVGGASGLMSVFVTIILLGGVMDVSANFVQLLDSEESTNEVAYSSIMQPNNDPDQALDEMQEELEFLKEVTDAYHDNVVVSTMMRLTHTDSDSGRVTPLNLRLFDMVFSIDYRDHNIRFRHELAMASDLASVFMQSDFFETQNVSDLEGDELKTALSHLANSDLLVAIMPLVIEVGTDYMDVDMGITEEELYAIDWRHELNQIGVIAGSAIEILNAAGVFDEGQSYETATFNGDDIESMFTTISETEVFTTPAIMNMALAQMGEDFTMFIDVPETMDWAVEFQAFGRILGGLASTEITIRDLQEQDFNAIFSKLVTFDLEMILDSKLLEAAMVNALSGEGDLLNVDGLIVPDDIVWKDEGESEGELRKILKAFNIIASDLSEMDIDTIDLNIALNLSDDVFDAVLESRIVASTLGNLVHTMSVDVDQFIVPNSISLNIDVNEESVNVVNEVELKNMINAFKIFNLESIDNVTLDASLLESIDQDELEDIFDSKIIHASLSNVMLDFSEGDEAFLIVPYFDATNTIAILEYDSTDEIDYIAKSELVNLLTLFIDLDIFDDFQNIDSLGLNRINENIDAILDSAILHATISDQLIKLDDDLVTIPSHSANDVALVIHSGSNNETNDFIIKDELHAVLDALEVLGITDVDNFDGDFSIDKLSDEATVDALLASAIIHANLSHQLLDATSADSVLAIPHFDETDNVQLRLNVEGNEYIVESELRALFDGLNALDLTENIETFDGNLDLMLLEDNEKRETILSSSILHGTISQQVIDQQTDDIISIPEYVFTETSPEDQLVFTVGEATEATDTTYLLKSELDAFLLGIITVLKDDQSATLYVEDFDGAFNLHNLDTESNQDLVLNSTILYATISNTIFDLGADVVIVPTYQPDDETLLRVNVSADEYIIRSEIKAMIDGFLAMDYADLDSFGNEIPSDAFFDNREILLNSYAIHATISDKLLNEPSNTLSIPDVNRTGDTLKIHVDNDLYTYLELQELNYIFDALEILDLKEFATLEFSAQNILDGVDIETLLNSVSIQLTVSELILPNAIDETDLPDSSMTLIVTTAHKVSIVAEGLPVEMIHLNELESLLNSLELLGADFEGEMDAATISNSIDNMDEILMSESMHVTIHNMIESNNNLSIPDLATLDTFNMIDDVTTASEIEDFIIAADTFITSAGGTGDFTNVDFTITGISSLDETDQDIILSSMIVRNILTDEIENQPGIAFEDEDYEQDDPTTFLRKATIINFIENPGDYTSF